MILVDLLLYKGEDVNWWLNIYKIFLYFLLPLLFFLSPSLYAVLLQHLFSQTLLVSVAEPHHFSAAPAPDENFDAAPAPAPTLLFSIANFLKRTKVLTHVLHFDS
jgi:hypothetical protein